MQSILVVDDEPDFITGFRRVLAREDLAIHAAHSGAEAIDFVRRMEGKGLVGSGAVEGRWEDLVAFKDSYTGPIPENNRAIYEKSGIEFIEGHASFEDERTLRISNPAGGNARHLRPRFVVLATGARPRPLGIPGSELAMVSDDFIHLKKLPRRIAFIGGGFISMEFAHVAARYGCECTVIHPRERPLRGFDPDLVDLLVRASGDHAGIRFVPHARVSAIDRSGPGVAVTARIDEGHEEVTVDADLVVHGAGRIANLEGLNLDAGHVKHSRHGITVNAHLRSTSNAHVYAGGDCADTGHPHLSMVASRQGLAIARNLLEDVGATVNYAGISSIVFTLPALASVGLSEEACHRDGYDFEVRFTDTTRWFTNRHTNEPVGAYKVLIEKVTGRILGAHLLAHHCEEFANLFSLAIHQGLTREDLRTVLWGHPSAASDLARILG